MRNVPASLLVGSIVATCLVPAFAADEGRKPPAKPAEIATEDLARALQAADPPVEEIKAYNIRIEVQMVAIGEALALPLIADLKKKEKSQAAHEKVQAMLADGRARLLGWPIITTKSGQRAVIEAIQEVVSIRRYDTPGIGVWAPDLERITVEPKVDASQLESVPSAFEWRDVGVRFEVEPVLGPDGKSIVLNLIPQHTRLNGYRKVTMQKPALKSSVVVERPELDVKKVTTSLTLQSGEVMLLRAFPLKDPPKNMELFILKAEVIPVD